MPGTLSTCQVPGQGVSVLLEQTLAAIGVSDWVSLGGGVQLQVTGVATAATVQLERSTSDPAGSANPAPLGAPLSVNPSSGAVVGPVDGAGVAWWRVRVSALTGASVSIAISGVGVQTSARIVQSRQPS